MDGPVESSEVRRIERTMAWTASMFFLVWMRTRRFRSDRGPGTREEEDRLELEEDEESEDAGVDSRVAGGPGAGRRLGRSWSGFL